ncbi:MAG TPA: ABC transporter permease subunit [Clostridiaceae bacterium]|nr:ABC transporter permease subunit [Clostridiaceae bacterium]
MILKWIKRHLTAVLFWLVIWWLLALLIGQELLVPMPHSVLMRLFYLVRQGSFYLNIVNTLYRITLGFVLATILGGILAFLTAVSIWGATFISPLMSAIRATPVASIIILLLIWLSPNGVVVSCVVLIVLPVIWSNLVVGINYRDQQLEEMAAVFKLSRAKLWRYLRLPATLPFLLAGVESGLGIAWKAGVAAEVLGIPRHAIGSRVYDAKIYLETADLFAWTAVVVLLSIILEKLILSVIRRLGKSYDWVK